MKLPFAIVAMLLASLLVLASADKAQAQWNDIDHGYAVTTEWGHSITAWAGTTDSNVRTVEFQWLDTYGTTAWNHRLAVIGPFITPNTPPNAPQEIISWAEQHPGKTVWYASDTQEPEVIGTWIVHSVFHGSDTIRGRCTHGFYCLPSLNAVPEVPFGTITIALSMFGILAVIVIRRRRHTRSITVPN